MMTKSIAIASDHAGYQTKKEIVDHLQRQGYHVTDLGTDSEDPVDYPEFGHPLAKAIESGICTAGISLCGSRNGINMVVNKYNGIRGALCWNPQAAILARSHNNANICSLPARFIDLQEAIEIVDAFIKTDFSGGRHERRINKIPPMG